MKKVILIGDSIRIGYEPIVRRVLAEQCEIEAPPENGGTSEKIRENLDDWVISREPDIVHMNCGLHDIKREFGEDRRQVPIESYRTNLEEIFSRIRNKTGAQLVWATTTPVNEEWHHERKPFDRFESDVTAYNEVARDIAERMQIHMNDLYGVVMNAGRDALLQPDGVHFNDAGKELLGQRTADVIRAML